MYEKPFKLTISVLLMLTLLTGIVSARPGVPHQFYGSVTVNGVSAPDGVLIEARIDGKYAAGTTTSDGKYGYNPVFYVPDPEGNNRGKTIEFYVQNVKVAQHTFDNGESTELDLSVTIPNFCGDGKCESGESCSSCPKDCGSCALPEGGSSEGGSGSSSGGGAPSLGGTEEEESEETGTCVEEWICTEWSECFNGRQKRVCADINRCGTEINKPSEIKPCKPTGGGAGEVNISEIICGNGVCDSEESCESCPEDCGQCPPEEGGKTGTTGGFTGLFTGLQTAGLLGLLVLLAVVLILLFLVKRKKR